MTTVLNLNPITKLTREQFVKLCEANPELQLERNQLGELIIMSPVGGESGQKEANLIVDISIWNRQNNLGIVFSSSFANQNRGVIFGESKIMVANEQATKTNHSQM
jgi:Uma2 family endonuclease